VLTVTAPQAPVASIVVTPATATIDPGATQQFTATAYDSSSAPITGVTFTWASSTPSVATVNATGLATGVSAGATNITATSGSTTGTAVLNVNSGGPYTPPNIRFSELHYDNVGTDAAEGIEIEGPVGQSLAGWSIQLYDGNPTGALPYKVYNTTAVTGTLTAPIACGGRGVLSIPIAGIRNAGGTAGAFPDGLALVDNNGALVEFLSYEGSFTAADGAANGVKSRDIVVMEDNPVPAAGLSLHRSANGVTWTAPSPADMGYVNACGGPPPSSITFSGRSPTADPPLPVGFEAQVFATEKVGGATVNTTFTWTSDTPAIASVDQNGVLRALSAGTAVLRATATDGATATYSLPTVVATQSAAPYDGNTEFGDPVDNDPSDDFIIRRLEYTTSFNPKLGHPNWVSEKLDATAYGPEDRCNCFTFDPELEAAGFPKYTTADYTGAGAFAGYGIDRGHMTRSADRTASNLDNARTYYFSNVLPQAATVNQGNWAIMENYLGDFAKSGKEVYVMSGGAGSKGTVKNQGKIDIPKYVWKVAVIMDAGKGLADVKSVNDLQVIAVVIPNDPTETADWTTYKVTVDSVEALTGYDLLSKLPDNIEKAVESNDTPPVAAISGATNGAEGSSLSYSASGSTDADAGDVLTYAWTFGDGGTATGIAASHTFADNGTYTVTVRATDSKGVYGEASMTATITNVAPTAVLSITPSSLTEGSSFTVALGGAVDPSPTDLASLTYAFDCGDGAGFRAASSTSSVSCPTSDNGVRTVNARVMDKDGGATSYTGTVTVANAAPVISSFSVPPGALTGAQVSVSFSDVGTADTHTVTFSWGDGSTSTVDAGLSGSATATHTYAATGFYAVMATVTDDDGASVSTGTRTLVVFNPSGGTLSGSGFLLGARGTKTYMSGSISYGGGMTPTGTFAITGNDAANLTSSSFDYLVINGLTATLKGSGTLTDGTPVTFLVRGLDNNRQDLRDRGLSTGLAQGLPNQDYARIKVWNLATGAVLFDSQPGAADSATPTEMVRGGSFSIRP
nr:DNA/RNA non-specific endonuclease [Gemmatimonadota bacterium]